jgi:hypothetical protein
MGGCSAQRKQTRGIRHGPQPACYIRLWFAQRHHVSAWRTGAVVARCGNRAFGDQPRRRKSDFILKICLAYPALIRGTTLPPSLSPSR